MTKADLFRRIARQFPGITVFDARELVDHFLEAMQKGLASGDTIELRDFGVLRVRKKAERKARNPKTGETVRTDAKKVVYFKQSRTIKPRLNQ